MTADRRLSDSDVRRLRHYWKGGSTLDELAREFEITPQYAGRIVRNEARVMLDVDQAVEDEAGGGVRGALERFLAGRVLDLGDDVLAETARALARQIDACATSSAATAAAALPRLADAMTSAIGEIRGDERPRDRLDELRDSYLARRARLIAGEQ